MNKYLLLGLILCFGAVGLSGVSAQDAVPWPTNGWLTASPESQGMDSALLAGAYEASSKARLTFAACW